MDDTSSGPHPQTERGPIRFLRSEVEEKLRAAGLSVTYTRVEVAYEVLNFHHHCQAEQINRILNKRVRKVSRATVFNTLHKLVEVGLLRRWEILGQIIFDTNTVFHEHVIWREPGGRLKMDDINLPAGLKQKLARALPAGKGDSPQLLVEFSGRE